MFKSVAATDLSTNATPKSTQQMVNGNQSNNGNSTSTPRTTTPPDGELNMQQRVVLKEQRLEDIKNQCSELISELE